jgi:acetylornithine deacetylase/succinyl-diaminopimelate desuccinylase-like protein
MPLAVIMLAAVCLLIAGSLWLRHREAERARLGLLKRQIRIEVLNGTEVERLGQKVADRLRKAGFDVVEVDNAEDRGFPETVVVDRADNRAANARLVARELECRNVIPQLEPTLLLEVTVIVGQDYVKEKKRRFLGL